MKVYLIGYAGSGKSSLGKRLAQRVGCTFVDTDKRVEQAEGASIVDIFYYQGEEYFRLAERAAVEGITTSDDDHDVVVATGGGLPTWGDNMDWMLRNGVTIYLKRSAENILGRLSAYGREKRPMFRGKSDEELLAYMREQMAQREPYYSRAEVVVDCSVMSDTDALEYIVKELTQRRNG